MNKTPKKNPKQSRQRMREGGGDNKKREIPMEYAVKREAKIRTENRRGRSLLVCLSLWAMRHPAIQESYRHLCICPPRRKEESKQIFREFDGFGQGFVQDFLRSFAILWRRAFKILGRFFKDSQPISWIKLAIYIESIVIFIYVEKWISPFLSKSEPHCSISLLSLS